MATKSFFLALEDQTVLSAAILLNQLASQQTLLSAHGGNLQLGASQVTAPDRPAERIIHIELVPTYAGRVDRFDVLVHAEYED